MLLGVWLVPAGGNDKLDDTLQPVRRGARRCPWAWGCMLMALGVPRSCKGQPYDFAEACWLPVVACLPTLGLIQPWPAHSLLLSCVGLSSGQPPTQKQSWESRSEISSCFPIMGYETEAASDDRDPS